MPKGIPCKTEAERLESKRAARARYRERHPERVRASKRACDARHPERVSANNAAWNAANPERRRKLNAAWRASNPAYGLEWQRANADRVAVHDATRRAREKGAPGELTVAEWEEILVEFDQACAYCSARGVRLEQEHMTPLSRGGRHDRTNVVPACRSCNAKKHTKTLLEFAAVG